MLKITVKSVSAYPRIDRPTKNDLLTNFLMPMRENLFASKTAPVQHPKKFPHVIWSFCYVNIKK